MLVNVVLVLALVIFFTIIVLALLRHSTRQRVEAARLAAMGTATGRILHQVKNPLQTILLHAEMLEDDTLISSAEVRRELCQAIAGEAGRMADLLTRLSTFASGVGQQLATDPLPLHEVVYAAVRKVERECEAAGIRVTVGPVAEIFTSGDTAFLQQALSNVIQNAYEALLERPPGGEACLDISLRLRGAGAVIEIQDNAGGIGEAESAEIFEPFVTRKGAGLGLGLPMAREIVEGHGGRIEVRSRPGVGLTVVIILPIRPVAASAGVPGIKPATAAKVSGGVEAGARLVRHAAPFSVGG
jgi:signal transduction histidine kinase